MEELVFRLRHAGESAEVGAEDPGEVDRSDRVIEAGVIPVMAIFLPGRILLLSDDVAREGALSRIVIWPVSPRSKSAPARRIRSGVGRARRPTNGRFRVRFGNFRTSTRNSLVLFPIFPSRSIDVRQRIRLEARAGDDGAPPVRARPGASPQGRQIDFVRSPHAVYNHTMYMNVNYHM
jgi:hypothetical protein